MLGMDLEASGKRTQMLITGARDILIPFKIPPNLAYTDV